MLFLEIKDNYMLTILCMTSVPLRGLKLLIKWNNWIELGGSGMYRHIVYKQALNNTVWKWCCSCSSGEKQIIDHANWAVHPEELLLVFYVSTSCFKMHHYQGIPLWGPANNSLVHSDSVNFYLAVKYYSGEHPCGFSVTKTSGRFPNATEAIDQGGLTKVSMTDLQTFEGNYTKI